MTFALTKVEAYGIEVDEPLTKRFKQHLILHITAANTDTDLDIGDYLSGSLGTFWDAVDGSEPGDTALKAIRDIATRAQAFLGVCGKGLTEKARAASGLVTYDSAVSAGGSATESLTFTGMAATDTILALTPKTVGANAASVRAFGSPGANALSVTFTADPGAGAVVRALVQKAAGTASAPVSGQYELEVANLAPNITFVSGDAPTALILDLSWELKDNMAPVKVVEAA